MILRDLGVVFIHIPKCAGTSVEYNLTDLRPKIEDPPDYELAWGWCPDRKIWMQHATAQQLVDLDLITRDEFGEMFSFTIVRNPFARAVSDYYFLRRQVGGSGSFQAMLKAEGRWHRILSDPTTPEYRGDHLRPQNEYVTIDGGIALDHIGHVEDLETTYAVLEDRLGRNFDRSVRRNIAPRYFSHYSHFYTRPERDSVEREYSADASQFGYEFDDQRTTRSRLEQPTRRAISSLDSVLYSAKDLANKVLRRNWRRNLPEQ